MERFNSRLVYVHEGLREFLRTLAALGGYCTVQQAMSLGIAGWDKGVRGRLRMLERLQSHPSLSVVRKHSDHEEQEQRCAGALAGVFGCNSASLPGAMEAESARILVCDAEQAASVIQQGRAVRIVARAGRAEDSPLRTPRISAHARKSAFAHGSHAEGCAGAVAARRSARHARNVFTRDR